MTKNRRGYALASTVALIFLMTILLGVAVSHLDYYCGVMEAYSGRFQARNALESMTNMSLKWLSVSVKTYDRPKAHIPATQKYLTDVDSLCIFSTDFDGRSAYLFEFIPHIVRT